MEVAEIFYLSDWYEEFGTPISNLYVELHRVLNHNATQHQKQPVKDPLQSLINGLNEMPLTELNLQQLAHLDDMGIAQFIGRRGAQFVEGVVKASSYDPATSAAEIKTAADKVKHSTQTFKNLTGALKTAAFERDDDLGADQFEDEATARIHFRQDASISNIAEMKKWSSDWNDIVRGIGHLVGETPQDMRVVGATKGSIIVCVSGSMMLVSAFAFMSKKVSGIVLDGLRVANAIEDLRHKKITNQEVEKALREGQEKREKAIVEEIVSELKARADGGFDEEHDAHLTTAVKKYVAFSKKGGEVDYLEPPVETGPDDEDAEGDHQDAVSSELRDLIDEIRSIKTETLLLSNDFLVDDE
ncbi:hypothetical protein [Ruegeria arenilitoris]|uniref:hypothetical protein n=1 Tax=Ruegeria arenilitoris TaxID=1173585 RepID=UPI00147F7357|nr:hypothetical protein [Ruegeria arenilitoris]